MPDVESIRQHRNPTYPSVEVMRTPHEILITLTTAHTSDRYFVTLDHLTLALQEVWQTRTRAHTTIALSSHAEIRCYVDRHGHHPELRVRPREEQYSTAWFRLENAAVRAFLPTLAWTGTVPVTTPVPVAPPVQFIDVVEG
jgi:hypothetical protein